jgi:DNA-directed RNA polymerase specialized sigma24 family protein
MTAKEYLQEIAKYKRMIETKVRQRKKLRESLSFIEGVSYDRGKVQSSPHDKLSESVIRVVDMDRDIENTIREYNEELLRRVDRINMLDRPEYIQILTLRYVDGLSFEAIAVEMNYSYYHTCHLHGDALREFQGVM